MPNILNTLIVASLSTIVFGLIAWWYVLPRLATVSKHDALVPLVVINAFRYLALVLITPAQLLAPLPASVHLIAYGDLAAAVFAILTSVLLRYRVRGSLVVTWIFVVYNLGDLLNGMLQGWISQLFSYNLGTDWYVITVYVPLIFVSSILILACLLRKTATPSAPA